MEAQPISQELLNSLLNASNSRRPSAEYLWEYIAELGARTLLVESHYVDRHYLDDFANYYSRAFSVPSPHCKRLHFFSTEATEIEKLINESLSPDYKHNGPNAAELSLSRVYLGFVVVRPLTSAPIGRTVLRTYPNNNRRQYTAVRTYRVHIMGLTLRIDGLAFQEQDGGAAVCASTALWSAFQKVSTLAGHRTPTPWEITKASGTPFAASYGLDSRQMATAIANLGYTADRFAPAENRPLFRAKLAACLQSRLPVVLLIAKNVETGAGTIQVGHAIVITGYSQDRSRAPVAVKPMHLGDMCLKMRGAALETIYVHDDNLGSHAHYEMLDCADSVTFDGYPALGLMRGDKQRVRAWWDIDNWFVYEALVPKPPKLRMPLDNLFDLLWSFAKSIIPLVLPGLDLHFAVRVTTGIAYREEVNKHGFETAGLRNFHDAIKLPRHIGVIGAWLGDALICEFLFDVTAIDLVCDEKSLLGIIAMGVEARSPAWKRLEAFTATVGTHLIHR